MSLSNVHSLHDRVIIVTGGSRGFGWQIAERLLAQGARVVLTASRDSETLEGVRTRAGALGAESRCIAVAADVRDPRACEKVAQVTMDAFGRIDVLINNAGRGIGEYGADGNPAVTGFWAVSEKAWRSIVDTNLTGAFLMTRAVVPRMIEKGFGKVISISTSLTTMVLPGLSPYGASKAGLEVAHVTWARELKPHKIDVNILLPGGGADTGFITQTMAPGEIGRRDSLLPANVIVPPALYLCSDAANGVTGRRIIAKYWDETLPSAQAFAACLQDQHEHPQIM